jgi:uncharacterized membrane protein (UPF0127 family)/predicted double-glycine peptidase
MNTKPEEIPAVTQKNSWSCGPAVAQMVARYFGHDTKQDEVAKALDTTKSQGTKPDSLTKFLSSLGIKAEIKEFCDLEKLCELAEDENCLVILNFQAWGNKKDYAKEWESGHYSVLSRSDKTNLFFKDPSLMDSEGVIPKKDFFPRWHDYDRVNGVKRLWTHMAIITSGTKSTEAPVTKIAEKSKFMKTSGNNYVLVKRAFEGHNHLTQSLPRYKAFLGGNQLKIMIADSEHEKQLGLMFVDSLPMNEGMLFKYNVPAKMSFWMKNTKLALDLMFFNNKLELVDFIENMKPGYGIPDDQLPSYTSKVEAMHALELPSGAIRKLGLKIGQKLIIAKENPDTKV